MIFTFVALLGASAIVSSNKSFIRLQSSVQTLHAGETFYIDVYVTAHVPVNAVDITLAFPKNQIKVTGIDKGESVLTLWTQEPTVTDNKVLLSGGTFRKGFIGDHKIATINAQAIETGLAKFSVDDVLLLAGDGSGTKVTVSKTSEDSATLYITKEDGIAKPASDTDPIAIKGTTSVVIITDIDGDGNVSLGDISRFMVAWQSRSVVYDFNGDGIMTFRDFGIILADSFLR